jgi:Autographiviridae endonuclease VII
MAKALNVSKAAKASLARGEKYYSTGKPCKRGHVSKRHSNTGSCVECKTLKNREHMKTNKFKTRVSNYRMITRYNLTKEEYNRMLWLQNGACAICRGIEKRKNTFNLAIDHDHKTGKVRGLLCSNCNRALGLFKDDPNLLKIAIEYLNCEG